MKLLFRSLFALLFAFSTAIAAPPPAGGGTQPLCTQGTPGCVTTNWGVIQPDSISADDRMSRSSTAAGSGPITLAVHPIAVADEATAPAIRSTISPAGLFASETARLVNALQRARFNRDGSIAQGEKQIAAAAADVARKAAGKYMLTLYVKVPQSIRPDESTVLAQKVKTINAVLSAPSGSASPQT